jgi:predicted aldo/keto reductase-like oxidoreductase
MEDLKQNQDQVSRRKFIASSLTCVASAGLMAVTPRSIMGQDTEPETTEQTKGEPIYRTLGRTGIKVPIVSMGVMNAGNPEVVKAAYEAGVRHFDTAARYQYGRNEQMVGNVLSRMKVRDDVAIATKIMRPAQRDGSTPESVKAKIIELCEGSLRRLKTDYADILYIHSVSSPDDFSDQGIADGMAELKKQGKIRAAGVSTHQSMATVINSVVEGGTFDVVLSSFNITMANDTDLLKAIANAASKGVGIIAMKTQAGGARIPNPDTLKAYSTSVIAKACLKWAMRNENITTSIPGFDNYQHMQEDFSVAYGLDFTEEEEKFLSDNRLTVGMGFCQQCNKCVPSCPFNVDVPSLMRTHMYAAQYANFHEARATLDGIPRSRGLNVCGSCTDCVAACANQVAIPERIENLKLMFA